MKKRTKVLLIALSVITVIATAQWLSVRMALAYEWPPNTACTTVMTPSINVYTGALYTFPGCVPPGWAPLGD